MTKRKNDSKAPSPPERDAKKPDDYDDGLDADMLAEVSKFADSITEVRDLITHHNPSKGITGLFAKLDQAPLSPRTTAVLIDLAHDDDIKAARDDARQRGTQKQRGLQKPLLDAWLDERLAHDPGITTKLLWRALPDSRGDSDLYRDGDKVVENYGNKPKAVSRTGGFQNRVTAARKRAKKPSE